MFNNKLAIAKMTTNFVVGAGASKIVKSIIENNVSEPENLTDKVEIAVGSVVLGSMVANHASKYANATIDEAVNFVKTWRSAKNPVEVPAQ